MEEALFERVRNPFGIHDALGVLLGRAEKGRGVFPDSGLDGADVRATVLVMIREAHPADDLILVAEEVDHRRILGDTGEQDQSLGVDETGVGFGEDRRHLAVINAGEKKTDRLASFVDSLAGARIVLPESQVGRPAGALPGVEIGRAFRNDEDVGGVEATGQIAQASERQQGVLVDRTVVVYEDDVDSCPELPVLEGIVQEDDIRLGNIFVHAFAGLLAGLQFIRTGQETAAFNAVGIDSDSHDGKLLGYLQGLVAEKGGGTAAVHLLETLALALVAAGQDGDVAVCPAVARQERSENHLRVRSFPRPTDRHVTDADGRYPGLGGLFPAVVIHPVPDTERDIIGSKKYLFNHSLQS